jgi:hypothetical protein
VGIAASVALSDRPIQTSVGGVSIGGVWPARCTLQFANQLLPWDRFGFSLEPVGRDGRLSNSTLRWRMCNQDG